MALLACPECGREVSSRAPACPGCGFPLASISSAKRDEYACGRCHMADQTVTVRSVLLSDRSFSDVGGTVQLAGNMKTVAAEAGRLQLLAGSSWVFGTRGFRESAVSRSAITLSGSLDLSGEQTSALADTLLSLIPPPVASGDYLEGLRKYAELLYCRRCGVVTQPTGEFSQIGPAVFQAFGRDVVLAGMHNSLRHHYRSSVDTVGAPIFNPKQLHHHEFVTAVEPVDDVVNTDRLLSRVWEVMTPVGTRWEVVGVQQVDMGSARLRMASNACRPKAVGTSLRLYDDIYGLMGHFSIGTLDGDHGRAVALVACASYVALLGSGEKGFNMEGGRWRARFEAAAQDALSLVRSA